MEEPSAMDEVSVLRYGCVLPLFGETNLYNKYTIVP